MTSFIPFLDLRAQYAELREEFDRAYQRVMASGWYILSDEVRAFEQEFAKYVGVKHCVGVGNGLEALELILMGYGIGVGDEVIVPANTYIASWLSVSYVGATPIPVETDPATHNIDPARIARSITKRTKAIMPVHLYGQPAEMDEIWKQSEQHGLYMKLAEHGVGISAMGIGREWNDIFLDILATRTGGNSSYIAEPQQIKKLLLEKFDALAQTYAEDVILTIDPVEEVNLSYVFRLQPDPAPVLLGESSLRLGPILQDASTRVIFECIINPKAVKSNVATIMDGTLKVSVSQIPLPVPPLKIHLQRSVSIQPESDPPPSEIVQALSRLMLSSAARNTKKDIIQPIQ